MPACGLLSTCGWNAGFSPSLRNELGAVSGDFGGPFDDAGRARIVNGGGVAWCVPFCTTSLLGGEPGGTACFGLGDLDGFFPCMGCNEDGNSCDALAGDVGLTCFEGSYNCLGRVSSSGGC